MSSGVARIARAQARLEGITAEIVLAKGRDLELSTWMIARLQQAVKACIDEPVFRQALADCRQAAIDYVNELEPKPAQPSANGKKLARELIRLADILRDCGRLISKSGGAEKIMRDAAAALATQPAQPSAQGEAVAHPSHQTVRDWMPVNEALRLADVWSVGDLDNCGQWRAAIKVLADEVRALASAPAAQPSAQGVSTELTTKRIEEIAFAVLRSHNDDRLWRALTYDSGPYDVTKATLALQDLASAFFHAGLASALAAPAQAVPLETWPIERAAEMLTAYAELVKATGRYAEEHYIPEIENVVAELRTLASAPAAPAKAVPQEWHLDVDAAETLKQTIGDDDTVSEITLSVCDGHEGRGLYVWLTEYPEEGSSLLCGIAPKAAQPGDPK